MIPASSTLRAAIDSPARQPVLEITLDLGGTDYTFTSGADTDMIVDYSLQRTPQEQTTRASQISGTIAAQCTFTLQGWQATVDGGLLSSADLSIYKAGFDALRDNDFGIDAKVTVNQGYVTTEGPEYVTVFGGFVDKVDVSDQGAISFLCLDNAGRLQGESRNLPYFPAEVAVQSVVEESLRKGGFYRSLPTPEGNCVLSVPSVFAEIGSPTVGLAPSVITSHDPDLPEFLRVLIPSDWGSYSCLYGISYFTSEPLAMIPDRVIIIEGRHASVPFEGDWLNVGSVGIKVTSDNHLWIGDNMESWSTPGIDTGVIMPRNVSIYLYVEIRVLSVGFSWYVNLDGVGYSGTSSEPRDWWGGENRVGWWGGGDHVESVGAWSPWEGISIRFETAGAFTRTIRSEWEPNYTPTWSGLPTYVDYVPASSGSPWALIDSIARGVGASYRWLEDGEGFLWETAEARRLRQFAATEALIDDSRSLLSSGFGYDKASRLREVVVDYQTTKSATDSSIIWEAPDLITAPANATTSMAISSDSLIIGISRAIIWYTGRTHNPALSEFAAVASDQVGDPAALTLTNVRVSFRPTPEGFNLTVTNPNGYEIALWSPETGAPYLLVRGRTMTVSAPQQVAVMSSLKSTESLALTESHWRQNREVAAERAEAIASEAALPAIVFSQQSVVGDPTTQIGDVISLQASTLMDDPIPCVIIGKDSDMDEDILTVVPVVPPVGWVLGFTGRTELGAAASATTILSA